MKAPFYIISDNHFMMDNNPDERGRRKKLFAIFDKIKKSKEGTLIIGGDFFDFWFETDYVVPNGYQDLIDELATFQDFGIDIHYIAGNHDYWDFGYLSQTANIIFHKNDLEFNLNDKKILITHGDGLLKNDYGYRFMKKIIRSSLFIKLFKLIPPRISFKLAGKLSKSSSEYNHNDKFINIIMRDTLNYAREKWEKDIDIVMVGHYHQQKIIHHEKSSLIFLGDWLGKYTVTTLNENNIWQGNWKEFIELT